MLKGGSVYRLITDHLGSVRLVEDAQTGAIAQEMTYDEFGRVLSDTNPGFQSFGFAGGLYDPDTGLVTFGARDYDPEVGRWTAKDPIGFGGRDTNLYGYGFNNPINYFDPDGRYVLGTFNRRTGKLTVLDLDTMRTVVVDAFSGLDGLGPSDTNGPIPAGVYEILERAGRPGWFRLDPADVSPRDDTHDPTGRTHFRMHAGAMSLGCVTGRNEDAFNRLTAMIENTSYRWVEDMSLPWFRAWDYESVRNFGVLVVVE